jgi:hypothetical protein
MSTYLPGRGAREDIFTSAFLHYAVKAGFVQTIHVLLEHGADRDALDDRGRTPFDWLGQAVKSVDRDHMATLPRPCNTTTGQLLD